MARCAANPRKSAPSPSDPSDTNHHDTMSEATAAPALPDRLSIDPASRHFNAEVFKHDIGIRLNDKERSDVEEYCISEGWVKVPAGRQVDRKGRPMMITLKGKVEVFYK